MPHDIGPDGTDGWDGQHLSACRWVGRTAPPLRGLSRPSDPTALHLRTSNELSVPFVTRAESRLMNL